MEKIFSYGTLQLEHVQLETFKRKLTGVKETLVGYILSELEITNQDVIKTSGSNTHPVVYYTGNKADEIEGMLFEVTLEELWQADEYEVKEYTRVSAVMKSGTFAWFYAATDS